VVSRTLFTNGHVFDGTGSPAAAADLVIEDGWIVEVGPGLDGDEAVDCAGLTVLPGLFDCHVHVASSGVDTMRMLTAPFSLQFYDAADNLRRTLDLGITTVRDAGGADLGVKEAVAKGLIRGPRMRIAISILSQTGGHGDGWFPSGHCASLFIAHPGRPDNIVDGPEGMRRKVRELHRAGADVIKVCASGGVLSPRDDPQHAQFQPDELTAAVAEAAVTGTPVMAHAGSTAGIKNAVRAGIRSIEHGIFLDDEAIDLMLEHDTWLVPTLQAPRAVIAMVKAGASLPAEVVAKAHAVVDAHTDSVRRAVAAGVQIAMGTDAGVGPHGHNLEELALMVEVGMTPEQALAATTSQAARLLGMQDELGRLAPGLRADVVLIEGDPSSVSSLDKRIRGVWKDGVAVVSRPSEQGH
jgi:imidazolonepropionase-like amidohydrolase